MLNGNVILFIQTYIRNENRKWNLTSESVGNLSLICKWGCDGTSGQSTYKQIFSNDDDGSKSDSDVFFTSLVPLQIVSANNNIVLWKNPWPSSPRFYRPISMQFLHVLQFSVIWPHCAPDEVWKSWRWLGLRNPRCKLSSWSRSVERVLDSRWHSPVWWGSESCNRPSQTTQILDRRLQVGLSVLKAVRLDIPVALGANEMSILMAGETRGFPSPGKG